MNGNGSTSGDQPKNDSLLITEAPSPSGIIAASTNNATDIAVRYSLTPFAHAGEKGVLFTNGGTQQKAQVIFTDMQGNVLYTNTTVMNQGANLVPVPNNGKVKGLVVVMVITEDGIKTSLKLGLN